VRLWALGQLDADQGPPQQLDAAAAAFGLVVEESQEPEQPTFWLWPEVLPLWSAWFAVQGQWRWLDRMNGPPIRTGLDLQSCESWLRSQGWGAGKRKSIRHAMAAIQQAEGEALSAWAEKQPKK
jgi:hypothetical protein